MPYEINYSPATNHSLPKLQQTDFPFHDNCTSNSRPVCYPVYSKDSTDHLYTQSLPTELCNDRNHVARYTNTITIQNGYYKVCRLSDDNIFQPEPYEPNLSNNCLDMNELNVRGVTVGGEVVNIEYPEGASSVVGVWTLGLGLLGDSESSRYIYKSYLMSYNVSVQCDKICSTHLVIDNVYNTQQLFQLAKNE